MFPLGRHSPTGLDWARCNRAPCAGSGGGLKRFGGAGLAQQQLHLLDQTLPRRSVLWRTNSRSRIRSRHISTGLLSGGIDQRS